MYSLYYKLPISVTNSVTSKKSPNVFDFGKDFDTFTKIAL